VICIVPYLSNVDVSWKLARERHKRGCMFCGVAAFLKRTVDLRPLKLFWRREEVQ